MLYIIQTNIKFNVENIVGWYIYTDIIKTKIYSDK